MKNQTTPYKIEISFTPGKGFSATVSQPGETRTCPDNFKSLQAALKFAEGVLNRAGFTTNETRKERK